jgi:hypothetical protein
MADWIIKEVTIQCSKITPVMGWHKPLVMDQRQFDANCWDIDCIWLAFGEALYQ